MTKRSYTSSDISKWLSDTNKRTHTHEAKGLGHDPHRVPTTRNQTSKPEQEDITQSCKKESKATLKQNSRLKTLLHTKHSLSPLPFAQLPVYTQDESNSTMPIRYSVQSLLPLQVTKEKTAVEEQEQESDNEDIMIQVQDVSTWLFEESPSVPIPVNEKDTFLSSPPSILLDDHQSISSDKKYNEQILPEFELYSDPIVSSPSSVVDKEDISSQNDNDVQLYLEPSVPHSSLGIARETSFQYDVSHSQLYSDPIVSSPSSVVDKYMPTHTDNDIQLYSDPLAPDPPLATAKTNRHQHNIQETLLHSDPLASSPPSALFGDAVETFSYEQSPHISPILQLHSDPVLFSPPLPSYKKEKDDYLLQLYLDSSTPPIESTQPPTKSTNKRPIKNINPFRVEGFKAPSPPPIAVQHSNSGDAIGEFFSTWFPSNPSLPTSTTYAKEPSNKCPICSCFFPKAELQAHTNMCIDSFSGRADTRYEGVRDVWRDRDIPSTSLAPRKIGSVKTPTVFIGDRAVLQKSMAYGVAKQQVKRQKEAHHQPSLVSSVSGSGSGTVNYYAEEEEQMEAAFEESGFGGSIHGIAWESLGHTTAVALAQWNSFVQAGSLPDGTTYDAVSALTECQDFTVTYPSATGLVIAPNSQHIVSWKAPIDSKQVNITLVENISKHSTYLGVYTSSLGSSDPLTLSLGSQAQGTYHFHLESIVGTHCEADSLDFDIKDVSTSATPSDAVTNSFIDGVLQQLKSDDTTTTTTATATAGTSDDTTATTATSNDTTVTTATSDDTTATTATTGTSEASDVPDQDDNAEPESVWSTVNSEEIAEVGIQPTTHTDAAWDTMLSSVDSYTHNTVTTSSHEDAVSNMVESLVSLPASSHNNFATHPVASVQSANSAPPPAAAQPAKDTLPQSSAAYTTFVDYISSLDQDYKRYIGNNKATESERVNHKNNASVV
ncbi:hypothetical protein BDF14DRAFT_1883748 [Spinellus fusiger]|nr:hypothetical protein BDF14DRAFT_1883748 [Spinellus fusiger]